MLLREVTLPLAGGRLSEKEGEIAGRFLFAFGSGISRVGAQVDEGGGGETGCVWKERRSWETTSAQKKKEYFLTTKGRARRKEGGRTPGRETGGEKAYVEYEGLEYYPQGRRGNFGILRKRDLKLQGGGTDALRGKKAQGRKENFIRKEACSSRSGWA